MWGAEELKHRHKSGQPQKSVCVECVYGEGTDFVTSKPGGCSVVADYWGRHFLVTEDDLIEIAQECEVKTTKFIGEARFSDPKRLHNAVFLSVASKMCPEFG